MSRNVTDLLRAAAARNPRRNALLHGGKSVTFAELALRVDGVAGGLRADGLAPGDRMLVMIPMSIELYVVLLGIFTAGGVAVFVDPWAAPKAIAALAAFAEPKGWAGVGKSHLLRLSDRRLRRLALTVTTGRRFFGIPARRTLAELLRSAPTPSPHAAAPDDPALVTFTSGSSGRPKGANRTHRFLAAQHEALATEFPVEDDDVDFTTFPVFALNNLALGIPTIVPEIDLKKIAECDPHAVGETMRRERVTTVTSSPPLFDRLAAAGERVPLRRILTGGAPVSDAQLERWIAAFPGTEIQIVYGSTEAEPVAHVEARERLRIVKDAGPAPGYCAGRPSSRVRSRLVPIVDGAIELDARGFASIEVPPGGIGELVVTGEHVGKEYLDDPESTRQNKLREADGTVWHRMGDTGRFDAEGRFWICGRVHSTIRRAGALIPAQLVEQAAEKLEITRTSTDSSRTEALVKVRRVAAVGVPDVKLGERLVVVVEVDGEPSERWTSPSLAAPLDLAGYPVDELVFTTRPLPVDPRHNSKIDYSRSKEWLTTTPEGMRHRLPRR